MVKTKKNRKMKGGFLGFNGDSSNTDWFSTVSQNASDMWNNISTGASNLWEKTKQSMNYSSQNNIQPPFFSSTNTGGKKTKKMRGGYEANTNYKSITNNAAPFTQPTAKPQVMLGGRSKKYRRHNKSRKHKH